MNRLTDNHIKILAEVSEMACFSDPSFHDDHMIFRLATTPYFFRFNFKFAERSWVSYGSKYKARDSWGRPVGPIPKYHTFEEVFSSEIVHDDIIEELSFHIDILRHDRKSLTKEEASIQRQADLASAWKSSIEEQMLRNMRDREYQKYKRRLYYPDKDYGKIIADFDKLTADFDNITKKFGRSIGTQKKDSSADKRCRQWGHDKREISYCANPNCPSKK